MNCTGLVTKWMLNGYEMAGGDDNGICRLGHCCGKGELIGSVVGILGLRIFRTEFKCWVITGLLFSLDALHLLFF